MFFVSPFLNAAHDIENKKGNNLCERAKTFQKFNKKTKSSEMLPRRLEKKIIKRYNKHSNRQSLPNRKC